MSVFSIRIKQFLGFLGPVTLKFDESFISRPTSVFEVTLVLVFAVNPSLASSNNTFETPDNFFFATFHVC